MFCAADNGHVRVVELLWDMARESINVNQPASGGWTPLAVAAFQGNVEIVEMLLDKMRDVIDVNAATDCGRTPMFCAADNGHVRVVELLLAHPDVDINLPWIKSDGTEVIPIMRAQANEHADIVALLQSHANGSKE